MLWLFWILSAQAAKQPKCDPAEAVRRGIQVALEKPATKLEVDTLIESEKTYAVSMRRDGQTHFVSFSRAMAKLFNDRKMSYDRQRYFRAMEMGYYDGPTSTQGIKPLKDYRGFYEVRVLGKGTEYRLIGCRQNGVLYFFAWVPHSRIAQAAGNFNCK